MGPFVVFARGRERRMLVEPSNAIDQSKSEAHVRRKQHIAIEQRCRIGGRLVGGLYSEHDALALWLDPAGHDCVADVGEANRHALEPVASYSTVVVSDGSKRRAYLVEAFVGGRRDARLVQ